MNSVIIDLEKFFLSQFNWSDVPVMRDWYSQLLREEDEHREYLRIDSLLQKLNTPLVVDTIAAFVDNAGDDIRQFVSSVCLNALAQYAYLSGDHENLMPTFQMLIGNNADPNLSLSSNMKKIFHYSYCNFEVSKLLMENGLDMSGDNRRLFQLIVSDYNMTSDQKIELLEFALAMGAELHC